MKRWIFVAVSLCASRAGFAQVTLQTNLENLAAAQTPQVGPPGTAQNLWFMGGYVGQGAGMAGGPRALSYPVSAIDLAAGSLELWYRSHYSATTTGRRRTRSSR